MTSNQLQAHFRTTLMKYVNTVIISDKKLVFPVPNFKIPRMLYGLFYMQYIAKPQDSSQNNAIRYIPKAILLRLFSYW